MDLSRIPLFDALAKRMAWLGQRQAVLAENVANADMPGYAARDVKEPDFRAILTHSSSSIALMTTQPGHIAARRDTDGTTETTSSDSSLNGNKVNLEDQMMKVSQTATDFAMTSTLYRANLNLVKSVLGRSS
jgi:flagellar basal-body rod protein FlgB